MLLGIVLAELASVKTRAQHQNIAALRHSVFGQRSRPNPKRREHANIFGFDRASQRCQNTPRLPQLIFYFVKNQLSVDDCFGDSYSVVLVGCFGQIRRVGINSGRGHVTNSRTSTSQNDSTFSLGSVRPFLHRRRTSQTFQNRLRVLYRLANSESCPWRSRNYPNTSSSRSQIHRSSRNTCETLSLQRMHTPILRPSASDRPRAPARGCMQHQDSLATGGISPSKTLSECPLIQDPW